MKDDNDHEEREPGSADAAEPITPSNSSSTGSGWAGPDDPTVMSEHEGLSGDAPTVATGGDLPTVAVGGGVDAPSGSQEPTFPTVDKTHYVMAGEIARGGMGRIIAARDMRLQRPVAVKELLVGGSKRVRRFEREALITARLQHPSIVPVYEAGRWPDGSPFFAMKRVSGRPLTEAVKSRSSIEQRLALLPHVMNVVEAMAYSHSQSVIHRDLKPDNVLVGSFGETVVIDWGLAKNLSDEPEPHVPAQSSDSGVEGLTVAGMIMGTPAYMAPEQARGKPVDERADVYALGAILYFVLSGEAPYKGSDSVELVAKVVSGSPAPLEERVPGVPRDLVAITRKAMEREPDDRYRTAKELADELLRFQTGKLVAAHTYTSKELVSRWMRRHRVALTVAGAAGLVVLGFGALFFSQIIKERRDREREAAAAVVAQTGTEVARAALEKARKDAAVAADRSTVFQAQAWLDRDPLTALAWLRALSSDSEHWQAARLIAADARSRGLYREFTTSDGAIRELVYSPTGQVLAHVGNSPVVHVRDLGSGAETVLRGHERRVEALAFSADGGRLVTASSDSLRSWNLETGESVELDGAGNVRALAFFPDGQRLATVGDEGHVHAWDLESGDRHELSAHEGAAEAIAVSADGKVVASGGRDGTVQLWRTGESDALVLEGHQGAVTHLAFDQGGQLLVSASDSGSLRVWDRSTGKTRSLRGHAQAIESLAFSSDGRWLATSATDGTVRISNITTGASRQLRGHSGVRALAFSYGGDTLATGGRDGRVGLCDVLSGDVRFLGEGTTSISRVSFSPNGQQLAVADTAGKIVVWEIGQREDRVLRSRDGGSLVDIALSAGWIATAGADGVVHAWALDTGKRATFEGHDGAVTSVALSPDESLLASAGVDGTVRTWNLADGSGEVLEGHEDAVLRVIFSPDGKRLVSTSADRTLRAWDLGSGSSRSFRGHDEEVVDAAFSPDFEQVASASTDGTVRLWKVDTGDMAVLSGHPHPVSCVSFSPDGKLLVSGDENGLVVAWDVESRESRELRGHSGPVSHVAFAADGRLATTGADGTVILWNLETGEGQPLRGHEGPVRHAEFSSDSSLLVTASDDGTARVWDVDTGVSRALSGHAGAVSRVACLAEGRLVASASTDGTVRLWRDDLPRDPELLRTWLNGAAAIAGGPSGQ